MRAAWRGTFFGSRLWLLLSGERGRMIILFRGKVASAHLLQGSAGQGGSFCIGSKKDRSCFHVFIHDYVVKHGLQTSLLKKMHVKFPLPRKMILKSVDLFLFLKQNLGFRIAESGPKHETKLIYIFSKRNVRGCVVFLQKNSKNLS